MATTYLTRTPASDGNRKTWTFSAWIKRSGLGEGRIMSTWITAETKDGSIDFQPDGELNIVDYNGSSYITQLKTNRMFRDTSGYYHIVVAADTTQATASDRVKIYVNGEQITSFATATYPAQNTDWTGINEDVAQVIGRKGNADTQYFDGIMTHVYFIDGLAYAPTVFGSIDATSGEWVINTSPSVTYGTNGFSILKDGNTITDQGSNSNDFTLGGGTLTDLQDCPDDVFASWNPLAQKFSNIVYEHCNTTNATSSDIGQRQSISTFANSSGKFYMECKLAAIGSNVGGSFPYVGISAYNKYVGDTYVGNAGCGWTTGGDVYNGGSNYSTGTSYTTGDIIGVAVDITNSKLYFHKDGTYISNGSGIGNPSSGTNGIDISARTAEDAIAFVTSLYNNNGTWQCNFGNGYFGTTAISSEGANASEIGKFEYDVPTGYTALSLKGLQE